MNYFRNAINYLGQILGTMRNLVANNVESNIDDKNNNNHNEAKINYEIVQQFKIPPIDKARIKIFDNHVIEIGHKIDRIEKRKYELLNLNIDKKNCGINQYNKYNRNKINSIVNDLNKIIKELKKELTDNKICRKEEKLRNKYIKYAIEHNIKCIEDQFSLSLRSITEQMDIDTIINSIDFHHLIFNCNEHHQKQLLKGYRVYKARSISCEPYCNGWVVGERRCDCNNVKYYWCLRGVDLGNVLQFNLNHKEPAGYYDMW